MSDVAAYHVLFPVQGGTEYLRLKNSQHYIVTHYTTR